MNKNVLNCYWQELPHNQVELSWLWFWLCWALGRIENVHVVNGSERIVFIFFTIYFFGFIFLILVKARQFYLIHCSILTVKKYLLQRWQWLLKSSRSVHSRTRARQPSRQYDNMVWCHKDNDKNPESGAPPATRSHPFCNHRVLGLAKFWITLYYNFCEYRPASLTAQLIIP